jgi:hypothetical protein
MNWLMDGTTTTSTNNLGNIWNGWSIVGVGDFNGDGKADILWRDIEGNTAIWLMNGGAVLSFATAGTRPPDVSVAGVGDFNGDGKADILWRDSTGNVSMSQISQVAGPSLEPVTLMGMARPIFFGATLKAQKSSGS